MELAKLIIQIIMIVIAILGIGGYMTMTVLFHRNGKKMNQKQKNTVVIAKLLLAAVLVCLAIVLNVLYATEISEESLIIILLASLYFAEQVDFLLKVDD